VKDVGKKKITNREAVAQGEIILSPNTILEILKDQVPKGDVLQCAKIAGIMAAKNTPLLIPFCHNISLDKVDLIFEIGENRVIVTASAAAQAKTGVEMEALSAVSAACLTIYDMCKSMDRGAMITNIKLMKKTGGKSGKYEIRG